MILAVLVCFLAVNAAAYAAIAYDKAMAVRGRRRVPERRLLGLALIGGSVGAVAAQRVLRHKTQKEPFRSRLRAILVLHGLMLLGAAVVGADGLAIFGEMVAGAASWP